MRCFKSTLKYGIFHISRAFIGLLYTCDGLKSVFCPEISQFFVCENSHTYCDFRRNIFISRIRYHITAGGRAIVSSHWQDHGSQTLSKLREKHSKRRRETLKCVNTFFVTFLTKLSRFFDVNFDSGLAYSALRLSIAK